MATGATLAFLNDSRHDTPLSPAGPDPPSDAVVDRNSLIAVIVVNATVTVVVTCAVALCLIVTMTRRARRKEERDKLCALVALCYWSEEDQIAQLVQVLNRMRDVVIHRDVTAIHILGYKYRCDNGVYAGAAGVDHLHTIETSRLPHPYIASVDVFATLKKIERFFDSLALQLPCVGECPQHIAETFSATLFGLARVTSLMWCDHKARIVRRLICYFASRTAAEAFDAVLVADTDLAGLVLSKVPYVTNLYLNVDHFVLKDVEISSDVKVDMKSKIRYVDTILAKNGKMLQLHERNIIDSYYAAREICVKNAFVQTKSHFPDIVAKVGEPSRIGECVTYLRHLLRLMCYGSNMRKMETDDRFFQFLMQLHETLYSWVDAHTMLEVIERSRANIISYLHGLTVEQILSDREFTKAKLEHVEKELYRHLNYLTVRQVQQEREQRGGRRSVELAPPQSKASDPRLRPAESEASVYTMAMSTSSYLVKRRPSQEAEIIGETSSGVALIHQQSLDQGSIVSGSSMYATAASLSSEGGVPSAAQGLSPPTPHQPGGGGPASDSEGEFFETPV